MLRSPELALEVVFDDNQHNAKLAVSSAQKLPVIPGVSETDIPRLVQAAAENGAGSAFMTLLRLPAEVKPVFLERLHEAYPEREKKVLAGKQSNGSFAAHMKNTGFVACMSVI